MEIALLQSRADFAEELARRARTKGHSVDTLTAPASRIDRVTSLIRNQYDLVQVDETLRGGVVGTVVSEALGIPLVLYFRGWTDYTDGNDEYGPVTNATIRARTRFVLRSADEVVYISGTCRDRIRCNYPSPPGRVIPRPFDVSAFEGDEPTASSDGADGSGIVLLTVTNLRYRGKFRGVKTTLEACRPLFAEHDLQYRIAGGGAYLDDLRSYVNEYEHAEHVEVLGFRRDVPDLLSGSDVFVYVSYNDAYPTAVLEAQAAGLPVVAGDEVGVPEAVGGAGLLCGPTPEDLREGLRKVISDEGLREDLARRSRERMSGYNEAVTEQFVGLWRELLDDE